MTVEVAEKLVTINPYVMGVVLVGTIVICGGLVHLVIWLVQHIVARKDSVVSELNNAINELRTSLENNSHEMQTAMQKVSEAATEMATSLRDSLDAKAEQLHQRINHALAETHEKLGDVHERITNESHERARVVVSLGGDIGCVRSSVATLQGRCDDRAKMCPHCNGLSTAHDHKG